MSDDLRAAGALGDTERLLTLEHKLKNCVIEAMAVYDVALPDYDTVLQSLEYACESFRQAAQSIQMHHETLKKRIKTDRHLRLVYSK